MGGLKEGWGLDCDGGARSGDWKEKDSGGNRIAGDGGGIGIG